MRAYEHDLFPWPDPTTDPPPVEEQPVLRSIKIMRHERGGEVWHPRKFDPSEIPDEEAIAQLFGGGLYDFFGYGEKADGTKCCVARRVKVSIAGASRPLVPVEPDPSEAPKVAAIASSTSTGDDWIEKALKVALALGLPTLIQGFFDARRASEQQQAQMTREILDRARQDNAATLAATQANAQALVQSTQQMSTAMLQTVTTAMSAQRSDGGGGLQAGVDLTMRLIDQLGGSGAAAPELPPPDPNADIRSTLDLAMQGADAFKKIVELAPNANARPSAPAAAPVDEDEVFASEDEAQPEESAAAAE